MRKLLLWCAGVGLALLMMAGAGVWVLLRSIDPPVPAAGPLGPQRPSEFGFVGVRCGLDDPVDDPARTDYVDEVAGFTTLAHVCVFENDVRRLLRDLPDHGLRALLDLSALLFEFVPGDAPSDSGQRMRLRADATERWERFVATNREVLDARHVAVYYLADEPVWNGASAADIAAAAELVEPDTHGVATMVIEGYPALADAVFPRRSTGLASTGTAWATRRRIPTTSWTWPPCVSEPTRASASPWSSTASGSRRTAGSTSTRSPWGSSPATTNS